MLKQEIKKIVGQERITAAKQTAKYCRDKLYLKKHSRIAVCDENVTYRRYGIPGKNVFFGYFDIQQLDAKEDRLLVHVVPKDANPAKTRAQLGFFDRRTGAYTPFAETRAWCWQQGARLRWSAADSDGVFFNDAENGSYVCRRFDLREGKIKKTIPRALYDMNQEETLGASVNFSRLQRLRPGYGYSTLQDCTAEARAPEDDGLFLVDMETGKTHLAVSLADLARETDDPEADQHYINHVSFSPDGKKLMFFYIRTLRGDTHWRTRLVVYDVASGRCTVPESTDRVSHYDWIGNDALLMTLWDSEKNQYYAVYDLAAGTKERIRGISGDGHPTVLGNGRCFVADTYPLAHDMQELFVFDTMAAEKHLLLRLYSDALLYDETRCDLHPRVSGSERYITVDTTFEGGVRQILLVEGWRQEA